MDLSVRTFGSGPKRALLLHGISSNAAGWWRVGPAIADMGYHVTAPDLPGHGDSPPALSYQFADQADAIAALGRNWDLVLGHSMGGAIAVLLAGPSYCSRLILEDPALFVPAAPESLDWLTRAYKSPITGEAVAAANPRWHPEDARIKAEALLQSSREVVEQTYLDNPEWNVMAQTLDLQVKTLLIGGDPDAGSLVPVQLAESLAAHVVELDYVMVPGGSHSLHRDEFDAFMAEIRIWLAS